MSFWKLNHSPISRSASHLSVNSRSLIMGVLPDNPEGIKHRFPRCRHCPRGRWRQRELGNFQSALLGSITAVLTSLVAEGMLLRRIELEQKVTLGMDKG